MNLRVSIREGLLDYWWYSLEVSEVLPLMEVAVCGDDGGVGVDGDL